MRRALFCFFICFLVYPLNGRTAAAPVIEPDCTANAAEPFIRAYPQEKITVRQSGDNSFTLILGKVSLNFCKAGESITLDPNMPDQSIIAALYPAYPAGRGGRYTRPGFNPGRMRNELFLKLLYGKTEEDVRANCEVVEFFGQRLQFNTRQGAAEALRRVVGKLEVAVKHDPALKAYILPSAGTFYWREIKGSGRLSAHSFAIAIDLNTEKGLYWQWNPTAEQLEDTRANYPQTIVEAFEDEGFIWGGKWSAFDFMHFEYRPEYFEPKRESGFQ